MDLHQTALINRVYNTQAIQDHLPARNWISDENYGAARALKKNKKTQDQMTQLAQKAGVVVVGGALFEMGSRGRSVQPFAFIQHECTFSTRYFIETCTLFYYFT